jgi:hypothetical protein
MRTQLPMSHRKNGGQRAGRGLHMIPRRQHRPEDQLQRAVCQHLQQRGARNMVWFAVPNGGKRRPVEAAIMRGLGVRSGVADLILVHGGRPFALELKADNGKPSAAQIAFTEDFSAAGGCASIALGLDHALRTLEMWGILRGKTNIPTQVGRVSGEAAA